MNIRTVAGRSLALGICLCVQAMMVLADEPLEQWAHDPQWLALLHMQRNLVGQYVSEADEPSFFLSGIDDDPLAELQATMEALRAPQTGDVSAWCQYPARAAWLQARADVHPPTGLSCVALERWRRQFHTDRMVLVFPAMYMNNPASLFGHTFLRFDHRDPVQHPVLLSRALSYYADVASAGSVPVYVLQGLSGGFDGVFEVRPYFDKIRKYTDDEERDIWEYELALTSGEIASFIDHAWEVRGHTFHYFFLDENCSYRLVAMLDAVVGPHDMRKAFVTDAMPLDTIKVLQQNGLIHESRYLPSAMKWFRQAVDQLSTSQRAELAAWADQRVSTRQLEADPALVQPAMTYAALQLRRAGEEGGTNAAVVLHDLLQHQADSQLKLPFAADDPLDSQNAHELFGVTDPATTSHGTRRIELGWASAEDTTGVQIGGRMAYHDFTDPLPGFDPGVRLLVMDMSWQWHGTDADLDHATWFAVSSRKPVTPYFQPASWLFAFSRRRELLGDDRALVHAVDGDRGLAWMCGEWLCHAELTGALIAGAQVEQGWSIAPGLQFGTLYQSDRWSMDFQIAQQQYLVHESHRQLQGHVEWSYRLARDVAWAVRYQVDDNEENRWEQVSAGIRYFF